MTRFTGYLVALLGFAACGGASPEAARPEAAAPARRVLPTFPGLDIADAVALGMIDGPNTAELTVIEAIDFGCPHCERMQGPIDELVREYRGRVRVVYKHYVLPRHPAGPHLAACAAGKQGKYRAFVDKLRADRAKHALTDDQIAAAFQSGKVEELILLSTAEPDLPAIAQSAGLDMTAFETERNGPGCRAFLDRDHRELDKLDLDHVPLFFVADRRADVQTKEELRAAIDARLAAAR